MLKKRLIGVITIRNNLAVQSFSYQRYLPVGKAEYLVENLDRWGVDEILIQVTDRGNNGPDLALLNRISRLQISTPVSYCGGIRNEQDAAKVIHAGAERIALDALLHDRPDDVRSISMRIGAQAVILSMPLTIRNGVPLWLDYRTSTAHPVNSALLALMHDRMASEILVIDSDHEGGRGSFSDQMFDLADTLPLPLIVFGGITDALQQQRLLEKQNIAAIAVGNTLNHSEHAVQTMKCLCASENLRSPAYQAGTGGWL